MGRSHDNPGSPPSRWPADTLVGVTFANGRPARQPYRIDQLVWEHRGWDFDIASFRRA